MSNILQYFPYPTPRVGQAEVLQTIEKLWDNYDVFVIVAPTAFGKTALMRTIQEWKYGVSAISPTNMLVDQFLGEFPECPTLSRLDAYWCEEWQRPCPKTRAKLRSFCKGCHCASAMAVAKYRRGPGIYNYHVYRAHKLMRPVLIVDEAHNLARTVQDELSTLIWQHDYRYPSSMYTHHQIRNWITGLPKQKQEHKKIKQLWDAVNDPRPKFVVERSVEEFNGKGTVRGQPEERDCIKFYPVDISEAPPFYWPRPDVEKIILLSATISPVDITELGLSQRRVVYLQAESPIPAVRRPVTLLDTTKVSHGNTDIDTIAAELENIAAYHSNEKGVIHVTYQLAEKLREKGMPDRFLFHTRDNKRDIYTQFREATDNSVLVACGMYEGIDLPDEAGRWQVIAKVPWKSLGDPAIAYKAEHDNDWYIWQTLRDFIQACGRVCRTETDYGITYCLDSTVNMLLDKGKHLIPSWFQDALEAGSV